MNFRLEIHISSPRIVQIFNRKSFDSKSWIKLSFIDLASTCIVKAAKFDLSLTKIHTNLQSLNPTPLTKIGRKYTYKKY